MSAGSVVIEVLGWLGSGLLIVSILQKRLVALRVMSLIASAILAGYNLVHGVLPMVVVNTAIVVVNAVYLLWPRAASRTTVEHAERPAAS